MSTQYLFSHKIRNYFIFFVFLTFAVKLPAQITIGSGISASPGALLDLKEKADGTSQKGLSLPRVGLSDIDELYPMFLDTNGEGTAEYVANKVILKQSHQGLIVYNKTEQNIFCPGIYLWDGSQWTSLIDREFGILQDKDGNYYPTQTFGNAGTWMLENLRTSQYDTGNNRTINQGFPSSDGDKVYQYTVNVSGSDFKRKPELGFLYSWAAASDGKTWSSQGDEAGINHTDVQGICPKGWKLPSQRDWKILIDEIAANPTLYSSNTVQGITEVGASMKSPNKATVGSSDTNGLSFTTCNGAGLNLYMTGHATGENIFYSSSATYWTSSFKSSTNVNCIRIYPNNNQVNDTFGGTHSGSNRTMAAIRCKKKQ